ncbi:hypothetical protein BH10PSE4_BH10PSE4_20450 [soil metagenome]
MRSCLVLAACISAATMSSAALAQSQNAAVPFNLSASSSMKIASESVARRRLATKAAALINAGNCPEALKLARDADDVNMANRITQACTPPKQQASR